MGSSEWEREVTTFYFIIYLLYTTNIHLFGFWLTMWGQKAGCWAAVLCRWCVLYYPVLHHWASSWLVSKQWQPSWFWHSNINLWTLSRSTQHFCVNICVRIVLHIKNCWFSERKIYNQYSIFSVTTHTPLWRDVRGFSKQGHPQ